MNGRAVRFGIFELDLRARELRKGGLGLKLDPKPLQVLELLLQRPGELVTRKELRETLWPDSFVQFDRSINTAVNKLRKVLGDRPDTPRYIETRSRLGYRFIAPVDTADGEQHRLQPALVKAAPAGQPIRITFSSPWSAPSASFAAIVNPSFDGDALRFQLERSDGTVAELTLRLATTESTFKMQVDLCGLISEEAPQVSGGERCRSIADNTGNRVARCIAGEGAVNAVRN
jgi:DNA-binding winged helix-turn-helix (wHTH) protein